MTGPLTRSEFEEILGAYRAFEAKVSRLMEGLCAPFCRVCKTPCCRPGICREAAESPFLLAVHGSRKTYRKATGYLGCNGCVLESGRPPLCHAFLCSTILMAQPDDIRRYALECLGDLVDHIGKNACRNRHLVAAMSEKDLAMMDSDHFMSRLQEAETAFTILDAFFSNRKAIGGESLPMLAKIRRPA